VPFELLPAERQFLEHAFQLGDNGKLKYSECAALWRRFPRKLCSNGWFTEGFDTLDLKEAEALLDKMAA
jgi:hypothetical protein